MPGQTILKGKRILAVDDEPDVLEMIRENLSLCSITTAPTLDEAVKFITVLMAAAGRTMTERSLGPGMTL